MSEKEKFLEVVNIAVYQIQELESQNKRMQEALFEIQHLASEVDEYRAVSEIEDICEALKEIKNDN